MVEATAPDYASQKVAELQDILKERGLPHTGKKADLIARLQASDSENSTSIATAGAAQSDSTATNTSATTAKTQAATPASAPKSSASETLAAAGGKGQPANPIAVPNQIQGEDPSADKGSTLTGGADGEGKPAANGEDASKAQAAEEQEAPKQDFAAHIPTLTLEEEMEKRRKRAERFGPIAKKAGGVDSAAEEGGEGAAEKTSENPDTESKDPAAEAQRLLERQKRFGGVADGGNVGGVDLLNQALPERARKRVRQGAAAGVEGERDGKRRDSRRREGRGEGPKTQGKGQGQGQGKAAGGAATATNGAAPAKKVTSEQAEKDRAAAEKRKARFAASAKS